MVFCDIAEGVTCYSSNTDTVNHYICNGITGCSFNGKGLTATVIHCDSPVGTDAATIAGRGIDGVGEQAEAGGNAVVLRHIAECVACYSTHTDTIHKYIGN